MKEIHKYAKDYTQEWFKREIARVFNADVELYVRAAIHLGGSRDKAGMTRGIAIMKRFGYWECHRADKLLTRDQMRTLGTKVADDTTTDQFHEIVDLMAEVLKQKDAKDLGKKLDYRKEYERLLAENARLRQEVVDLKHRCEFYEARIEVSVRGERSVASGR